jgi:hypothetical protein
MRGREAAEQPLVAVTDAERRRTKEHTLYFEIKRERDAKLVCCSTTRNQE